MKKFIVALVALVMVGGFTYGYRQYRHFEKTEKLAFQKKVNDLSKKAAGFEKRISNQEQLLGPEVCEINDIGHDMARLRDDDYADSADVENLKQLERQVDILEVKATMSFLRRHEGYSCTEGYVPSSSMFKMDIGTVEARIRNLDLSFEETGVTKEELQKLYVVAFRKEAMGSDGWNYHLSFRGKHAFETAEKIYKEMESHELTPQECGVNMWLYRRAFKDYRDWHGDYPFGIDVEALGLSE